MITANNKTNIFKTGDRVIHTVNNPKLGMPQNVREYGDEHSEYEDDVEYGVFNGEVGIVRMVNPMDTIFSVEYPNGNGGTKTLQYKNPKEQGQVQQAWCITVHKSQGSEYDVVFLSLPKSSKFMMDKTLLYTAVTRAAKLIFIIYEGEELDDFGTAIKPSVIDYAVKQNKPLQRNTGLEFLLKQKEMEISEQLEEDYAIFTEQQ
jgi:ATP-dependent exoDNAse (exonuclease V) alpha subunit